MRVDELPYNLALRSDLQSATGTGLRRQRIPVGQTIDGTTTGRKERLVFGLTKFPEHFATLGQNLDQPRAYLRVALVVEHQNATVFENGRMMLAEEAAAQHPIDLAGTRVEGHQSVGSPRAQQVTPGLLVGEAPGQPRIDDFQLIRVQHVTDLAAEAPEVRDDFIHKLGLLALEQTVEDRKSIFFGARRCVQ